MTEERTEALFAAIKAGDEAATLSLLEANPELAEVTLGGVSPVRAATYAGNKEFAKKIGAFLRTPTLFDAAALGRSGQIVHLEGDANGYSEDGFTPLTLAAAFGNEETVRALVAMGAQLELFSINEHIKVAPIHAAAFGANSGAISALLEAGANPNLTAEGGFTALHSAAQNNDAESIRVLLAAGADRTIKSDEGKEAVDYAKEPEIIAALRAPAT